MRTAFWDPSDCGAVTDPSLLEAGRQDERRIEELCVHSFCGDETRKALLDLLLWKVPVEARHESSGRTVHLRSRFKQRIKLKGGVGFDESADPPRVVLPAAQTRYVNNQPWHLALRPDLTLQIADASPRYLRSLSAGGAAQEYTAHERLAQLGLAAKPLLRATFSEVDGSKRPTGCVAVELFSTAVELARLTGEPLLETGSGDEVLIPYLNHQPGSGDALWQRHARIYRSIGAARRQALQVAGIARHAGHHGNVFLLENDAVQLADFDSTIDYDRLSQTERCIQLLRDVTADLVRTCAALTTSFLAAGLERRLEEVDSNPFLEYLRGFYGGEVDEIDLIDSSAQLSTALQNSVGRGSVLAGVHEQMREAYSRGEYSDYDGYSGNLQLLCYGLWPIALRETHLLTMMSDLPDTLCLGRVPEATAAHMSQWRQTCARFISNFHALARGESSS